MAQGVVPAEIAAAIDELMWAAEIQGQDTMAGDDEVTAHSEAHTNVCRMALDAAILRYLRGPVQSEDVERNKSLPSAERLSEAEFAEVVQLIALGIPFADAINVARP